MKRIIPLLTMATTMLIAQDKFAVTFVGDDRKEESNQEMRIFDEVAKGIGINYVWVLPSKPLASDTSDCKYSVDFICNFNKENRRINVMLKIYEMDGVGGFELSLNKDNADFEKDGKALIGSLLKIGIENIAVMQKLR